MVDLAEFVSNFQYLIPLLRTFVIVVVLIFFFNFVLNFIERSLVRRVKTKRHISDVEIFVRIIKYIFIIIIIVAALFSYLGDWRDFGIFFGILSAALGFALQKPITGVAAWVMLVTKRPFEIGDRVVIGSLKGDVLDITLTHVHIAEIGGTIKGEELSGRTIMVPNFILFEQNIINYTLKDEYVLSEVVVTVTYESDLDKAIDICLGSAHNNSKDVINVLKKEPFVRTFFQPSGIDIYVRYFSPARKVQEYMSNITKEIFTQIMRSEYVEIAYPHMEVLFSDGNVIGESGIFSHPDGKIT